MDSSQPTGLSPDLPLPDFMDPARRPGPGWTVAPGVAFATVQAIFFLSEWVRVGVIADPAVLDTYPWGWEADSRYASPERYAWTSLGEGIYALAVVALFAQAVRARSHLLAFVGYGLAALPLVVNYWRWR